jgi:hypothetical protein
MDPTEQYSLRLAEREQRLAMVERTHQRLGSARLMLMGTLIGFAWVALSGRIGLAWLALPAAAFIAAVLYHQRVRADRGIAQRAVRFYRAGLERLQTNRNESGPTGERFNDEHHVYGADLDLFGNDSLFQRLCSARTPMGETVLAQWLLSPADLATIHQRHTCVTELCQRLDLREDLTVLGDQGRIVLEPAALARWAAAPSELAQPWLRFVTTALVVLAAGTGVVWAIWGIAFPFLAVLVIEAGLNYALRRRVHAAVAGIEHAYEDIKLLSQLLRRVEAEPFTAPPLQVLSARLRAERQPPDGKQGASASASKSASVSKSASASTTLSQLATLVNFVEARRNPLLAPLMLPLLYTLHAALAAERWRRRHGSVVAAWLDTLGEIEALESIAGYAFERPEDTLPQFMDGPATFRARGLGHPLLAAATRIRNDVDISGQTRVLVVSGSNMSGKSTLLRSVGMNTVLAMAGAPVCASELALTPLQVGASIRVNDSLHEGSSRFYAEITRLRQLFEPYELPLLFLLDELLQGTNSKDRRIGAHGVLRALLERGAIGLVSTHDLALTDGHALTPGALVNVHFQDELNDGKLTFDFKLRDGVVTKSNGIELMRAIGLDV